MRLARPGRLSIIPVAAATTATTFLISVANSPAEAARALPALPGLSQVAAAHRAGAGLPTCPAVAPKAGATGSTGGAGGAGGTSIGGPGAGPTRVQLCGYSLGRPLKERPPGGVMLGAGPATVLAQLLDGGASAPASQRACQGQDADVLMRFMYSSGPSEQAVLVDLDCPPTATGAWGPSTPGTAFFGNQVRTVAPALSSLLEADAGSYATPSPPVAPDLFGLPAMSAQKTAESLGFTAGFGGEEVYPEREPGSVLLQYPPAGMGDIGSNVDVMLAAPPAAPCSAGDLTLSYDGFQGATGNYFGNLTAWDNAGHYCRLTGPVTLSGANGTGTTVTPMASFPVPPGTVLSPVPALAHAPASGPESPAYATSPPLGEVSADFTFSTPTPFACNDRAATVPAEWKLVLPGGGTALVRNGGKGVDAFSVFCGTFSGVGSVDLG